MLKLNLKKSLLSAQGEMLLDASFVVEPKSFVALSGVSGSGKTTLLRMIAGLETPQEGEFVVDGEVWFDKKTNLPPQKRKIGFVFQDYALFPNMSVQENLLYAQNDKVLAEKLIKMVELDELKNRKPEHLSGGQKQRVALARALMRSPKLLLLDEPLSALDPKMRGKLQDELLSIHNEFGITTILVSHDHAEIYKLANRVITLENGKIVSDKNPRDHFLEAHNTQKFSFKGEVLDVSKVDAIHVAVIAIGNQIVEIVLDKNEAKEIKKGDSVVVSTKSFAPTLYKT